MTNKTQHQRYRNSISRIGRQAVTAAWALAVGLASGVIATPSAQAQTFTTLHSFDITDGEFPGTGLIQASNGDLYGSTSSTIFKITVSGTLTTLANSGSSGLVQAINGDFYGTTAGEAPISYGTIFKMTPGGTLTTLYNFCSQNGCTDGQNPTAGLVQAANGDFYGTTYGSELDGPNYYGTIFKITPGGTLTTLVNFNGTDGLNPYAGLVQGTDGNLYGTTELGGPNGGGTVFKITPGGGLTTLSPKVDARTANTPSLGSSRPPMGTSTGRPTAAGPMDMGRSSGSPQAVH